MENQFTQGLFIKIPNKAAPDFVLLDISVKPHEFFKWCQDNLKPENNGWVNIQVLRSKDGSKLYGKLNTYKRPQDAQNQKEAAEIFDDPLTPEELDSLAAIPF